MRMISEFEDAVHEEFSAGNIPGFVHLYAGEEASRVGVCMHLDDRDAIEAIQTIADACRGLLFLEVPTVADRDGTIDPAGTDLDVHWRTGTWYRTRLATRFTEIGGGLWLSHDSDAVLFELERAR